jgi:hypothetical protein|tara:strand:+ start:666 stop:797 length:132 start_codon:yes stop_codon:yes gene_type:complete
MIEWFLGLFRKETVEEKIIKELRKGGYPPFHDKDKRFFMGRKR